MTADSTEPAPTRVPEGVAGMRRMHADELDIDSSLVRRLLDTQFPQWADLPIERVASPGTDNAIFRLGADLSVRLPRIYWAVGDAEKEAAWLLRIAPHLPVAVPVPVAIGAPDGGYPWHWSVTPWLPGENAFDRPPSDLPGLARDLARFVHALHGVDAEHGPPLHAPRAGRGVSLSTRNEAVLTAVEQLNGVIDTDGALAAWKDALDVSDWDGAPVWIHGDLQQTNLLMQDGRLTGVIDFGGIGVGDPAADLIPAWSFFDGASRDAYRNALAVDEATWARGRGWALSVGLMALPYYAETNPVIMEWAQRSVDSVVGTR